MIEPLPADKAPKFNNTADSDRHYICEIGRLFWGDNKQCYAAYAVYNRVILALNSVDLIAQARDKAIEEANEKEQELLKRIDELEAQKKEYIRIATEDRKRVLGLQRALQQYANKGNWIEEEPDGSYEHVWMPNEPGWKRAEDELEYFKDESDIGPVVLRDAQVVTLRTQAERDRYFINRLGEQLIGEEGRKDYNPDDVYVEVYKIIFGQKLKRNITEKMRQVIRDHQYNIDKSGRVSGEYSINAHYCVGCNAWTPSWRFNQEGHRPTCKKGCWIQRLLEDPTILMER